MVVLKNQLSEYSLTETAQELLLLACTLLLTYRAVHLPAARGALILAAGFFACLFVREMDFLFDELFWHGSWAWIVTLILICCFTLVWLNRTSLLPSLAHFSTRRPYLHFVIGIAMLLVFSRIFGSGGAFWKYILVDYHHPRFKAIMQEGMELYAYLLITLGMFSAKVEDWVP